VGATAAVEVLYAKHLTNESDTATARANLAADYQAQCEPDTRRIEGIPRCGDQPTEHSAGALWSRDGDSNEAPCSDGAGGNIRSNWAPQVAGGGRSFRATSFHYTFVGLSGVRRWGIVRTPKKYEVVPSR